MLPSRRMVLWLLGALAVAFDAVAPAAQLYLARCGVSPFMFDAALPGRLAAHLGAFPYSSAAMVLMCLVMPVASLRNWLYGTVPRLGLMCAAMPAACALAWPLAASAPPVSQARIYGSVMLALPLVAEHLLAPRLVSGTRT